MLKLPTPSLLRWLSGSALVVVLTLGFGLAAWSAQPESRGSADTKITITFKDVTLGEAIEKVVGQAGLRLGTPDVLRLKNKVSFSFQDEPVSNVLEIFGEEARLTPKIFDGVVTFGQAVPAHVATSKARPVRGVTSKAVPVRGVTMTPPHYPQDARDQKVEGTVLLIVDVAADGSVTKVAVERGAKNSNLDAAAMKAAAGWKFIPQMKAGKAVASRVRVPVDFRMDDPDATQS